jgi:ABC-type sugar transport system substrate-binding protein
MTPDPPRAGELAGLLAGDAVGRRALLRGAAVAAIGLPGVLAACGKTTLLEANTSYYKVDTVGTSPPSGDLARLITQRAAALHMRPSLSALYGIDLVDTLQRQTRLGLYVARTNKYEAEDLILVAASQPAQIEPLLAAAVTHGTKIVAYPAALRHQTAAILVDVVQAATMLATHAAAWATSRRGGRGKVLLLLPDPDRLTHLKRLYQDDGPAIEQALRTTLARAAPGLTVVGRARGDYAALGELVVGRALSKHPDATMVLSWHDDAALGAATALRHRHASASPDSLYVGALGMPAVFSRDTLTALMRDDVLRVVIAARARDLANAMVELPHALLRGDSARDVRLALQTLTPRSAALTGYIRDYARVPSRTVFRETPLYSDAPNSPPPAF